MRRPLGLTRAGGATRSSASGRRAVPTWPTGGSPHSAVSRTGRSNRSFWVTIGLLRSSDTGTARSRDGKRSYRAGRATPASSRDRAAPGQTCGPWPKEMCRFWPGAGDVELARRRAVLRLVAADRAEGDDQRLARGEDLVAHRDVLRGEADQDVRGRGGPAQGLLDHVLPRHSPRQHQLALRRGASAGPTTAFTIRLIVVSWPAATISWRVLTISSVGEVVAVLGGRDQRAGQVVARLAPLGRRRSPPKSSPRSAIIRGTSCGRRLRREELLEERLQARMVGRVHAHQLADDVHRQRVGELRLQVDHFARRASRAGPGLVRQRLDAAPAAAPPGARSAPARPGCAAGGGPSPSTVSIERPGLASPISGQSRGISPRCQAPQTSMSLTRRGSVSSCARLGVVGDRVAAPPRRAVRPRRAGRPRAARRSRRRGR